MGRMFLVPHIKFIKPQVIGEESYPLEGVKGKCFTGQVSEVSKYLNLAYNPGSQFVTRLMY